MSEIKKIEERLEWALERIRDMEIWMIEKEREEKKGKEKYLKELKIKEEEIRDLRKRVEMLEKKAAETGTQDERKKEIYVEEKEEEAERDKKERKRNEKSLFIRKGLYWKQVKVLEWIKKKIGEEGWWTEKLSDNVLRIDFEEARGRKKLWKWRWVAREENFYALDEWLSLKEREDRFHLVKTARELEEKKNEKGERIKIRLENRCIKIGEEWFKWSRKEGRLKKIPEEEVDEEPIIESWKEAKLCEVRVQEERTKLEKERKEKERQEKERVDKEMKKGEQNRKESAQTGGVEEKKKEISEETTESKEKETDKEAKVEQEEEEK